MTADKTARRWRAANARLAAMERIAFTEPEEHWALRFDIGDNHHVRNVWATVCTTREGQDAPGR